VSVIDPHGDLTADILGRLPERGGPAVHVLRLADRAHPRGFNFLERHGRRRRAARGSEFVTLLADLWPRFCGPKMQHYLRHALFAAFADRDQQTILELIRILTNDAARVRYTNQLSDPMERAFWRDEWPGPRERERDPSIKAVLNKLGAFVSYGSIRSVVGQGDSTISPRMVMDSGDVLVVDLSGVGGDNSALFGAMLISRFAIDAVGRQGRPASERRPHLLVVDEAQRFHTQALEGILAEGRKFGLHAALAAQSLSALGERLGSAVRTNVASVALLEPGPEDVRDLGRLFAPVSPEELLAMRRFDVVVRTRGSDGTPLVRGGRVSMPGPADPERLAANVAASDERDAPRSLKEVEDEVHRRSGGDEPEEEKPAETNRQTRTNRTQWRGTRRRNLMRGAWRRRLAGRLAGRSCPPKSPESSTNRRSPGGKTYMSAAFRTIEPGSAIEIDPDLLPMNDRACLRLLVRCGAANSSAAHSSTTRPPPQPRNACSPVSRGPPRAHHSRRHAARSSRVRLPRQVSSATSVSGPDALQRLRRTCATCSIP
jgi:hypothetical protein